MKKRLNIVGILALVFTLSMLWFPAGVTKAAAVINVPGDDTTIQAAIDYASSGDTVQVTAGTYEELITLKDGVQVLGAGATVTTISGSGLGTVVTANNVGPGTKLDGFTITGGGNAVPGGGMVIVNSSPSVSNCTFSGNHAYSGGGMLNDNSSPRITNCIFSGNTAHDGGGMENSDASAPTVVNCIFSGNIIEVYEGAGMYNIGAPDETSSPIVTNCTFSNNSGGYAMDNEKSSPILTNCIFWGNPAGEIYNNVGCSPTVNYSDVQMSSGTYSGSGNINADPKFSTPGSGYHLQAGSPCIDTGTNSALSLPSIDFDGQPRTMYGGVQGSSSNPITDMGAYEFHATYVVPVPKLTSLPMVAEGDWFTVGLKSDGTVLATGQDDDGQLNISSWTGIIQVAAGYEHTVGLKSDGTVVATGLNNEGQCNIGSWTGIKQVAAGENLTVGLKSDGSVIAGEKIVMVRSTG